MEKTPLVLQFIVVDDFSHCAAYLGLALCFGIYPYSLLEFRVKRNSVKLNLNIRFYT